MEMCRIIGYIRCSCDKSDVENQRFEILNFCNDNNLVVDEWVEETISGTKDYSMRKLGEVLERSDKNCRIICCEISRIGRNMFGVMDFLNKCMRKGCQVWTIKDNFRLGDDLSSKVIAFAFALSAEIERSLLSQRTKESLARLKAEGKKLGTPQKHTTETRQALVAYYNQGHTMAECSAKFGIPAGSVHRIIKESRAK